jgi:voltage-gated potassium channel
MGREIVKELPKERVVVVDVDNNKVNLAREEGYVAIHGDATDDVVLEKAGVREADAIVCCMTDASNAFTLLTAREMNPNIMTIAVLRNPDAEKKMVRIGADVLLSPYRDTAKKTYALITKKASVEFLETIISGNEELNLEKVIIEKDEVVGKTLKELDLRSKTGCMVVAIVRNGEVILPEADTKLEKGDILYMMCRERAEIDFDDLLG